VGRDGVVGGVQKTARGDPCKHMLFGGCAVYVHYFKDIRQGALESDCVMLSGGTAGWGLKSDVSWG